MKEAGYEWDAEKKELKKIEQTHAEWGDDEGKHKQDVIIQINPSDYINDIGGNGCYLKNTAQDYAWNEEDERLFQIVIDVLDRANHLGNISRTDLIACVRKLKSLMLQNNITDKELAQAKKDAYNDALDKIEYHSGEPTFDDGWRAAIDYIRKKYLTPQTT
jgi:hypothetical protein